MKNDMPITPEIKKLLDEWCQLQDRLVHPPETQEQRKDIIRAKEIHLELKNMEFFAGRHSERIYAEYRLTKENEK